MNDASSANAYLKTKVMTAPPEELRLMLLDGAIRFARRAREGLETDDPAKTLEGFSGCRNIVLELADSIKTEPDAELAKNMKGVYLFLYGELVRASFEKDTARLDKAIELLEYERETWARFIEKLGHERENGAPAAPRADEAPTPRSPLSVQA